MDMLSIQYLNMESIKLLSSLLYKLEQRGLVPTELTLKVFNKHRSEIYFDNIKDYLPFKTNMARFLAIHGHESGYNIAVLQYIGLSNSNLERYGNTFKVDTQDLTNPRFLDTNKRRKVNQPKIDREVERYKRLIQGLLFDFQVAYKINLDKIVALQENNDSNTHINYVNVGYLSPSYVTPQQ